MLIFTNRALGTGTTAAAFGNAFIPGSEQLAAANVTSAGPGWKITANDANVSDDDAYALLAPLFAGNKPVLLYVHGNNNSPATCFNRIYKLQSLYPDAVVIGFSWPSEGYLSNGKALPQVTHTPTSDGDEEDMGKVKQSNRTKENIRDKIRRFHQAQTNGKDSIEAFARLLRLIASARLRTNGQPFSLAIHSLGTHLFQYSLQADGATEAASVAHNIALLAPCVRAVAHKDWLTRFRPKGRIYITYNKGDTVLLGAYIADGQQMKLGAEPGVDRVKSPGVRYISFSDARVNTGGHGYFVNGSLSKKTLELFTRIFTSQNDFDVEASARDVYPLGCDPDGTTCYMAVPKDQIQPA